MVALHARAELASISSFDASTRWDPLDMNKCNQRVIAVRLVAPNLLSGTQVLAGLGQSLVAQTMAPTASRSNVGNWPGSLEYGPVLYTIKLSGFCHSIPRSAPSASATHIEDQSTSYCRPRLTFIRASRERSCPQSPSPLDTFAFDNNDEPPDNYLNAYG
jgi:hypothetical protein